MTFDPDRAFSADVIRAFVAVSREKQVTLVAASLAYYSFNSLLPFLLLVFVVISSLGRFHVLAVVVGTVVGAAPVEVETFLRGIGRNAANRERTIVIAVAVFTWSALRMFRAVHGAFGEVYETRTRESLVGRLADTTLVVVTVLLALLLMGSVAAGLSTLARGMAWSLLGPFLSFCTLVVVFVPIYYLFPETRVSVAEVLPGAVLASGAWTTASVGLRVYTDTTSSVELYGVAGAVLLLLTWLYVGGFALLGGAVLNALLAGRVEPDREWAPSIT